jgi:LiaI-LiaF-like transmembrane region
MGPAVLITIGVLFLLNQVRSDVFDFSNTWPFILIVIGAILLGSSLAPMTGHIDSTTAPPPPAVPPASGAPTAGGPAQSSMPGQGR